MNTQNSDMKEIVARYSAVSKIVLHLNHSHLIPKGYIGKEEQKFRGERIPKFRLWKRGWSCRVAEPRCVRRVTDITSIVL